MSKYGVISGPNIGKYGPEITLYLDAFHAMNDYFYTKNGGTDRGPVIMFSCLFYSFVYLFINLIYFKLNLFTQLRKDFSAACADIFGFSQIVII